MKASLKLKAAKVSLRFSAFNFSAALRVHQASCKPQEALELGLRPQQQQQSKDNAEDENEEAIESGSDCAAAATAAAQATLPVLVNLLYLLPKLKQGHRSRNSFISGRCSSTTFGFTPFLKHPCPCMSGKPKKLESKFSTNGVESSHLWGSDSGMPTISAQIRLF